MATTNDIGEQISQKANQLREILEGQRQQFLVDDAIFSHASLDKAMDQLANSVREVLAEIFGPIVETKNYGIANPIFDEKQVDSEPNYFPKAVVFTYWSHYRGERDLYLEKSGIWRDNLFYKGDRWSKPKLKDRFYNFFRLIQHATKDITPIPFFVEHAKKEETEYLRIVQDNSLENSRDEIVLPTAEQLRSLQKPKLTELVNTITKYQEWNLSVDDEGYEKFLQQQKSQNILDVLYSHAFQELSDETAGTLDAWKRSLVKVFPHLADDRRNPNVDREVFSVVTTYQYLDHPYDIHMFSPQYNKGVPLCCLVITLPRGWTAIRKYRNQLLELVNTLSEFVKLENELWKRFTEQLPNYWAWRRVYEKEAWKFNRLSDIAVTLCKAICNENEIPHVLVRSRLKEFESFFNKVVAKANDPNETEHAKLKQALKIPSKDSFHTVLKCIGDIAGTRVIVNYEDDAKRILDIFTELGNVKEDIRIVGEIKTFESVWDQLFPTDSRTTNGQKDDTEKIGYRSYHVHFKVGKRRAKLYECQELADLEGEIQIRTTLMHAWADVSHELQYKPKVLRSQLEFSEEEKIEFRNKLLNCSVILKNLDLQFVELKDTLTDARRKWRGIYGDQPGIGSVNDNGDRE